MHKNTLFLLKNCKHHPALGAPPSGPLASGGEALRPQWPPADLHQPPFRNSGYATAWSSPIQHIAEARRTATANG